MTQELRTVFELKDISGIRVICKACKTAIVLSLDSTYSLTQACPYCRAEWNGTATSPDQELISVMRRASCQKDSPIELQFEMVKSSPT